MKGGKSNKNEREIFGLEERKFPDQKYLSFSIHLLRFTLRP